MGEYQQFQPLTKEDRITTVLYRTGISLSSVLLAIAAFLAVRTVLSPDIADLPLIYSGLVANIIILSLYFSIGLSVFFIHLYIGKFHRILKKIYYLAILCLVLMFVMGKGSPASIPPAGALLLIPLSLCLGFITAKEAFCFKLLEGYLLGMIMPAYLFLYGMGLLDRKSAAFGLALIAAMLVLFVSRKVFMPLHCDIGDKSAYQP
ncbi:MAG: hypothetical protein HZB62_04815 [Nitrospirae bacterium]|nr:hypothetical protein [Nitrospirota bacterium]